VESASNGREGIGAYIESLHNQKPFSLILLDIRMPDINGVSVLDIIRKEEGLRGIELEKGVPILMLTAYDTPWMDPSLIEGCDDYILKSSNNEELLKKIEEKIK
jgi:CheY-like chemotaxis protein